MREAPFYILPRIVRERETAHHGSRGILTSGNCDPWLLAAAFAHLFKPIEQASGVGAGKRIQTVRLT